MRPLAQAENKDAEHTPLSLFNFFVNCCKENLHVILAFSPIGDAFRNRLRKFPSLINCCTIDWFQAWPDDALGGWLEEVPYHLTNTHPSPYTHILLSVHTLTHPHYMHTHSHTYTHAHTYPHTHTHTHTHAHNSPSLIIDLLSLSELVANRFLEDVQLSDTERAATVSICKHFHQSTRELSEK